MKYFISTLICIFILTSCEKEITLPYRSIEPLYVIEGRVNNEVAEVIITRTRDMEDGQKTDGLGNALVTLTGDDATYIDFIYGSDGYYRPGYSFTGEVGKTYSLQVRIDGEEYISDSKMPDRADITDVYFRWLNILSEKILFLTLEFTDIAGENNHYCYRIYRNGEGYRWHVLHDRGNDGNTIIVDIICMSERQAKDNKEEDWDDILYEGDEITVELQTIDLRTYDYLYSLVLSERTSTNPIDNFSGGCLGYFSAYSVSTAQTRFDEEHIR